jgi:hypothetical protein
MFVDITCADFLWNQKRNVSVIAITLCKACLSLPVIRETSNWLTSVCGVLVYQISHKSAKKCGHYGRKIIYAFKQCLTTGDFHETRACWTTLIQTSSWKFDELFICRHLVTNNTNGLTDGRTDMCGLTLTFILLMWTFGQSPSNASKWEMGFNSVA